MDTFFATHRSNGGIGVFAVCVLLLTVLVIPRHSVAGNLDCDALLNGAASRAEIPQITIDAKTGTVRVATSDGRCSQGPEPRVSRQLPPKKKPRVSPPPVPAATPRASVTRRLPSPRRSAVAPVACDKTVGKMWTPGVHRANGVAVWLRQIHTIDLGGDGRIDNVGFRLRPLEGEDLVLTYFAAAGRISAKSVPGLALAADSMIARLCFGQATYEKPASLLVKPKNEGPFEVPDIALEMAAAKNPGESEDGDGFAGLWMGIAGGAPLGLVVGGIGAYLVRRKRRSEAENEDADEEGDADE